MTVDARTFVAALEAALEDERAAHTESECLFDAGYVAGLERAADILVAKKYGLKTAVEM